MSLLRPWNVASMLFLQWIYFSTVVVKELNSLVITPPRLGLDVSLPPKEDITAGDKIVYSALIYHTKKSYAHALDVELQLYSPVFVVYGSYSVVNKSLEPDSVTKNNGKMVFKFANVSISDHVRLTIDIHVDPYYMLGTRDSTTTSIMASLYYYGSNDSCARPANKWNARSFTKDVQFTFVADKICERVVEPVDESQFSASSFLKDNYEALGKSPHHASFNSDDVWTPSVHEDIHQFLQIELRQITSVTKIATKGNGNTLPESFVKKYVVYYSRNKLKWFRALSKESDEFDGNDDSVSVKINVLRIPVEAKFVRIVPKEWRMKIALKVQLYGCPAYRVPDGYQPLGLSTGAIKDSQISVASGDQITYPPSNARLNFNKNPGGWCTDSSKQTLIVDLEKDYVITELVVQSGFQLPQNLIKSFHLAYKSDGGAKTYYKHGEVKKLFFGNPLEDITIHHKLLHSVTARHIYLEPYDVSGNINCLRMELYGYKKDDNGSSDFCDIIDFENAGLLDWTMDGTAFDNQPTYSDNFHARTDHVVNHEGAWWIGTRENRSSQYELPGKMQGNTPTGTLISPPFLIPSPKLTFLFAGSSNSNKARVELLVDGNVVRQVSSDTGNETMVPIMWDVTDLLNVEAKIRLVDEDADGFVSFDGLKASCFPIDEKIPLFEKSVLLNPSKNLLYICQHSHKSNVGMTSPCRVTDDNGVSWKELSRTFSGLLGFNKVSEKLYGVSTDARNFLESTDLTGKLWKQITPSVWEGIRTDPNVVPVLEIPHFPITGQTETDDPQSILTLTSNAGNSFAASAYGVHYKPNNGVWKLIATWCSCKEYPNKCISNPCSNGGTCSSNDGSCTCISGFAGPTCDTNIDDCHGQTCSGHGTCVDGINHFFCFCDSPYYGKTCENKISACSSSPCQSGGTCVDGTGTFSCQCPSGFVGELCELETEECASLPCKNGGVCVDGLNSYTCHCRRGYSGTNCETAQKSAFKVVGTQSVSHGIQTYLVVRAEIPPDGRSLHQSWCHDYEALCYSYNKRPTGCGRSFNHMTEYHQCQTLYDSVMDTGDTLGCPPNNVVATIAKKVYAAADSTNSFAFSHCGDTNCSNLLPSSGCHGALTCISQGVASREVYTLCSDSDSNFFVKDKKSTTFKGVEYLALYVQRTSSTSRHENWCRDYQRLCESYGKRPTGCGRSTTVVYSRCDRGYFSVMPIKDDLGCDNSLVHDVAESSGLPNTAYYFGCRDCTHCTNSISSTCPSLNCLTSSSWTYHALCTEPQTSFIVLDERQTVVNNTSLLVIKARIPDHRKSTQGDWCRDYYTLCDSYGRRPTGCGVTRDSRYTSCRDNYGSVRIWEDNYTPERKVAEIARNVGFSSAKSSNSFAFHQCTECSSVLSTNDCEEKGLGCVNPDRNGDVYTVCVDNSAAFDVVDTKPTTLNGVGYLAVKAKAPETSTSDSTEYEKLCFNYGYHPIKCNINPPTPSIAVPACPPPSRTEVIHEMACVNNVLNTILQKTGLLHVKKNIDFSSSPFSSSNGIVHAVCHGPDSNFDVVSTKATTHAAIDFLLVQAWLPSNGLSRHRNWCEDYKRMCYSLGHHPVGCGGKTYLSNSACTSCRVDYDAKMTASNILGCPMNQMVATLANQAGFPAANLSNTIAFSFCNETGCVRNFSANYNVCIPVYTACRKLNGLFIVESTSDVTYQGGAYKVVKATLSGTTSTTSWCTEYSKVCSQLGWKAVETSTNPDLTCGQMYDAIAPTRKEFPRPENLNDIVRMAGYQNTSSKTVFAFQNNCHDTCYKKLSDYKKKPGGAFQVDSDVVSDQKDVVYALCMNSDSNFYVVHKSSVVYENREYVVLKTTIPQNGVSKHENWCLDYQRLCRRHQMRPVAFLEPSENSESCIQDYQAVALGRNMTVTDHVSVIANLSGYSDASKDNSFALGKCNSVCPKVLSTKCSGSLDCLTNVHREVYTVCTDSDSTFVVEKVNYKNYKDDPLVVIQGKSPDDDVSKYDKWCTDYYQVCRSFGREPEWCASSTSSEPGANSCCDVNYLSFVKAAENAKRQNIKVFNCIPLRHFEVLEQKQYVYNGHTVFVVKTQIMSNSSDWCEDYKHMCDTLGKRPFSCLVQGDKATYDTRDKYNTHLYSGVCPSTKVLLNMSHSVGFSMATENNLLSFINCTPQCGKKLNEISCFPTKVTNVAYTFCSYYAGGSRFNLQETKEVESAGLSYTVVRAKIPVDGQSKGSSWCEDYQELCTLVGKRPVGCGKDAELLKHARDCRVKHNAIMIDGQSCPSSEDLTNITIKAGFTPDAKQSLGLWKCTECSNNFADVWSTADPVSDVYLVCLGSDNNFNVLETQSVKHNGARLTAIMATLPEHGMSLHEHWCRDYSKLCQSYGLRPVACPKTMDTIEDHAQCQDHYQALMFSNGETNCSESLRVNVIANAAGFKHANTNNSFQFRSCLPRHCAKSFHSTHFGDLKPQDNVVYTVCASSDSGYEVLATKSVTMNHQDYLVVRAMLPLDAASRYENWCRDYQRLCEGYNMKPLICKSTGRDQRTCVYDYEPMNLEGSNISCPINSSIARIAMQAGFDEVSEGKCFAFDFCDEKSCVPKMPNVYCRNVTYSDRVLTVVTKDVNITRVDNKNNELYCFVIPDLTPPLTINGNALKDILKNFTCNATMNPTSINVTVSDVTMTGNQTFESYVPRVEWVCSFNSDSFFSKMSGEVTTVCLRPSAETNFQIKSTSNVISSGREYLVIKAKLLSPTSKSQNWCTDYKNLCQALGTSPLSCPRAYGFNADYLRCSSNYESVMMSGVEYGCPSNGFVARLAQSAGYQLSSETNSFSLVNCHDEKCVSTLPPTGCSESLHCLNQELLRKHVYTACVVANSDSNFHIKEKRPVKIGGQDFTALRILIPNTRSLHDNWCFDYQRMCESLSQRPFYQGSESNPSRVCQRGYNAIVRSMSVAYIARQAGFVDAVSTNSFSFKSCDTCSSVLTSTYHDSFNYLKATTTELYAVCGNVYGIGFLPLSTKRIDRGNVVFRLIQAKVATQTSPNGNWGQDYKKLCQSYNELPSGCGERAALSNSYVKSCEQTYSSYLLPGDELQCKPNDLIAKLARDAGFANALPKNSFGFSHCSSSCSTLDPASSSSSSCSNYLPNLRWEATNPIVYTVCAKPSDTNFKVISKNTLNYLKSSYLVIHARLPDDGKSKQMNWCSDYQTVCDTFSMRPIGCGSNSPTCRSMYDAHLSTNFRCGDNEMASWIAKRAGFPNALSANTVVFQNCDDCSSELRTTECDKALGCISTKTWKKEVYLLCVNPPSNFDVVRTANVEHDARNYLVFEVKLPSHGRSKSENWCEDYENLCKQYDKLPVSCEKNDRRWECTQEYESTTSPGFSCDMASTHASSIALKAGFSQATSSNSFVLKDCGAQSCCKDLNCKWDKGLSFLPSNTQNNVYTICAEANPVFKVIESKKLALSGADLTIVSATVDSHSSKTWCQGYSQLCHTIGQSPIVLSSGVLNEDTLKCRDEFDGVILPNELQNVFENGIYTIAQNAGFSKASYGNTFAFNDCSTAKCNSTPSLLNCSEALQCLNGETEATTVYGVCVQNTPLTNFFVLDSATVITNYTEYLALKVRVPLHRLSKHETWCKDYEHICHLYNTRPLTSLSGSPCQMAYTAVGHTQQTFITIVNVIKQAGFPNASSDNVYHLQHCTTQECGREFRLPQCVAGSCPKLTNEIRDYYILCSSLAEQFTTNFELQEVRNGWSDAAFLVARVRLPVHGLSKQDNWCEEYRVFCASYNRRPYSSVGLLHKDTFAHGGCFWGYNATTYRFPVPSLTVVQDVGFNSTSACVSGLHSCFACKKQLDASECPLENCQAAVETCQNYFIICT